MMEKVTLENQIVRLEPLSENHAQGLWEAGRFGDIWKYMPLAVTSLSQISQFIEYAAQLHAAGTALPLVTIEPSGNQIVGSTGFWNADFANRRIEIGFTWITPKWQRTAINTASKFLMLQYGFETLDLNRVEFKTDALNINSQTALKRIGAKPEGILRRHMVQPDGRIRDSMYFSIIKDEWPAVKSKLAKMCQLS